MTVDKAKGFITGERGTKMFKVKTSGTRVYDVTADVVVMDNGRMHIVQFVGEGSNTKNVAKLARSIRKDYSEDGVKVLAVGNICVSDGYIIGRDEYEFDMTRDDVIKALVAYADANDIKYYAL